MLKYLKNKRRFYRHKRILQNIRIEDTGTALDLSCGDGQFLRMLHVLKSQLALFGIDISSFDIKKAKKELSFGNFNIGNVEKLNFEDESFNVVFSILSLHHYEKPEKIFEEVRRVLKKDGSFYLIDIFPKFRIIQKLYNFYGCSEPYHFEKYYSKDDVQEIIQPIGFSIFSIKSIFGFSGIKILKLIKK